jgi:D-aminopeptidase
MTGHRIQDFGVRIGTLPAGPLDKITDVPGVRVGHLTLNTALYKTGVTVIVPPGDNIFLQKPVAACFVHNGFGKTCGLAQIDELGVLETPIALTGTLNVGLVADALNQWTVQQCEETGVKIRSVNPVVGECNDGRISTIAHRPIKKSHVFTALENAAADFDEGDVGAGKGTICFGLKGGIGSASRQITLGDTTYTVGVLVQSNYGASADLTLDGNHIGPAVSQWLGRLAAEEDQGSIMMVLATDLPVNARQLRRILRRCGVGLARTGSYMGHGSGEIMLGFTTANHVPYESDAVTLPQTILREDLLGDAFRAAAEATEEAILNSLAAASPLTGVDGIRYHTLTEFLTQSAAENAGDPPDNLS